MDQQTKTMLKYPLNAKMAEKTKKNNIFFAKLFDIYKNCCNFAKIFRKCR